ncbi:branched-chain amino acid transport system II carrier protein [Lacticaseibacillus jixianensis]|uniref:Branched-chain amino acid transport system carrier protein n=1 Tax=Lacticaseibacillus jixianensis TaxID=2486012 RepID=A0ABW4B8K0_9LACO|nr:branched-chain amino acid transport system II carrier protein [Lacticaseibacillus jixianensis]
MDSHRLTSRELLVIGSMLFGLFFGAGNLIFPVFVGQQAGSHLGWALLGFLVSGVGLPLLGVAAIGITKTDGVYELAGQVNRHYAFWFTLALYICIGPAFALPRLAPISYEIGLAPLASASQDNWGLLGYSLLFFGLAWWFARRPTKIMAYVGKILTPAFLVVLGILLVAVVVHPLGQGGPAAGAYRAQPLLTGFTAGYSTMDALAALAFGIIVVDALKALGVTKPTAIAGSTIKAGALAVVLMAVLYALLAVLGRNSLGVFARASNGGPILAHVAHAYFGDIGSVLLAAIVILACLKTAIGLISAFGDTLHELFPRVSYHALISVAAVASFVFANFGLDAILGVATPVLYFLYPMAITLILLSLLTPWLGRSKWLFNTVTIFTVLPALLDGLNALPAAMHHGLVAQLLGLGRFLPGFAYGLGWLAPATAGLVVGTVLEAISRHQKSAG